MTNSSLPSHKGNRATTKDKDGVKRHYKIIDEVARRQSNAPRFALYLQQLEPIGQNDPIEVRFCYYYEKDEGGWGFARNPPMMPVSDFFAIADQAKGWREIGI
jgi:hypothetical protein